MKWWEGNKWGAVIVNQQVFVGPLLWALNWTLLYSRGQDRQKLLAMGVYLVVRGNRQWTLGEMYAVLVEDMYVCWRLWFKAWSGEALMFEQVPYYEGRGRICGAFWAESTASTVWGGGMGQSGKVLLRVHSWGWDWMKSLPEGADL